MDLSIEPGATLVINEPNTSFSIEVGLTVQSSSAGRVKNYDTPRQMTFDKVDGISFSFGWTFPAFDSYFAEELFYWFFSSGYEKEADGWTATLCILGFTLAIHIWRQG